MAAVAVPGGVGVVLEQVDVAVHAFVAEALLGTGEELFEDPLLPCRAHDEFTHAVTFGRGVLGVAADVEVEPGPVRKEDVAAATPRHHPAEEVSGDFVGLKRRWPRRVQVTPYSFSIPKIRRCTPPT